MMLLASDVSVLRSSSPAALFLLVLHCIGFLVVGLILVTG